MKAVVAAFNQEKALVGAFSVITNLRMQLFEALTAGPPHQHHLQVQPRGPRLHPGRPLPGRGRHPHNRGNKFRFRRVEELPRADRGLPRPHPLLGREEEAVAVQLRRVQRVQHRAHHRRLPPQEVRAALLGAAEPERGGGAGDAPRLRAPADELPGEPRDQAAPAQGDPQAAVPGPGLQP